MLFSHNVMRFVPYKTFVKVQKVILFIFHFFRLVLLTLIPAFTENVLFSAYVDIQNNVIAVLKGILKRESRQCL